VKRGLQTECERLEQVKQLSIALRSVLVSKCGATGSRTVLVSEAEHRLLSRCSPVEVVLPSQKGRCEMTATSSNLSDARYGYDLVCAVTQESINATMKAYLASAVQTRDFSTCYVIDPTTKALVPKQLTDIFALLGGKDPFAIPSSAGPSDPRIQRLAHAGFSFGFKAKIGLPAGVPLNTLDIIRLDRGATSVSYRVYFAELSVIVLDRQSLAFSTRPVTPWMFDCEVGLELRYDDDVYYGFNQLPQAMQQRLKALEPNSRFRVARVYLDTTRVRLQQPAVISGLNAEVSKHLTGDFLNQYWRNLGRPLGLFGSVVVPVPPRDDFPATVPSRVNVQVSPHVDDQGRPTSNFGLYTLDYLVVSKRRPLPPPAAFNWNWIDASQAGRYRSAITIRRDIFLDGLLAILSRNVPTLFFDTNVEMHHGGTLGMTYEMRWSFLPTFQPTSFTKVAPTKGSDGYTKLASFAYSHKSYDDAEDSSHGTSINSTFDSNTAGEVAIGDGNKIRVTLNASIYVEFNVHIAGKSHTLVEGNHFDLTHVTTYHLAVGPNGKIVVRETASSTGGIQNLDYRKNEATGIDSAPLKDVADKCADLMKTNVVNAMVGLGNAIPGMIDTSQAWALPGRTTFFYQGVGFSSGIDLVTHVNYDDERAWI
jgi:hypothetical protein